MENIETLLAAVAQTQGFDDDEPAASTPSELGLENSESAAATQLAAGVPEEERPAPAVHTAVPSPAAAIPAAGQVIACGEKRKRGRPPRAQVGANPPPPKPIKVEDEDEDVCFICFDGGSLVLCDRKGCPKAYHPACIKRDEAFFKTKSKWNCGWHICSVCRKASSFLCYTCTYSLCKACIKNEDFLCVRGNKGFCSTCIKPIMLIENKDQATNDSIKVDFDDKLSWEYLFKMYWLILKEKLSLTLSELTQAKNPWKVVATETCKPQFNNVLPSVVGGEVSVSSRTRSTEPLDKNKPCVDINVLQDDRLMSSSNGNHVEKINIDKEENVPSYYKDSLKPNMDKANDQMSTSKAIDKNFDDSSTVKDVNVPCISGNANTVQSDKPTIDSKWASKDLLEFVAYMKNGDTSAISQFDVQTLLLDYIKRNHLQDPRRKSQIICDQRLKRLFGKPRVGHIEMLKLLEFHFLLWEDPHKTFIPPGLVSSVANGVENDGKLFGLAAPVNSRKRKTRKKSEERAPLHDSNEYAAIDVHNMSLIYLRRNFMETLAENLESFSDKVIGSIVRIKISADDQKPEVHRIVQVIGTSKVAEPYKIGNKTTDVMLEVLNLDRKELVPIYAISNEEFTKDECKWLRQSIKCGLVKQFTVDEVKKKASALQSVRVDDLLEAEILRLNHVRDRAAEKGLKKELRGCVNRLKLLKSPKERQRRISEVPPIHADPTMNPDYESEEDTRSSHSKKDQYVRASNSPVPQNDFEPISSNKRGKEEHSAESQAQIPEKTDASRSNDLDKSNNQIDIGSSPSDVGKDQAMLRSKLETATAIGSIGNSQPADNIETEKLWHYRDPNSKIQGPFSMMQLRKCNTTELFPPDMRIWTNHEQYDSLLLTDALNGKFHAAPDLSHKASSSSPENGPTGGIVASEGTNGTTRDNKQTEAAGCNSSDVLSDSGFRPVKAEESCSSGWPRCWDLLKDGNPSADGVQTHNLLPPSIPEMRGVPLTVHGRESDEVKRKSQSEEKNSGGLTQNPMSGGDELQSQPNNEDRSSEGNLRPLNIDLSKTNLEPVPVCAAASKSPSSTKQAENIDVLDLLSPTAKTENQQPISAGIPVQGSGFLELLSPALRSNNEDLEAQENNTKQSGFLNLPVPNSGPGWIGQSSLGIGGVQLPDATDEWCGYSHTPARPPIQEWDSGHLSASSWRPPEFTGENANAPAPYHHELAHASSAHPSSNGPNWLAIMNEPIEFVALGEDSVSDLLAEVDAMESRGALPSPTSAIKFARELLEDCKDDCFSSIEDFGPTPEPRKSDALSSTSDVHLTSQSSAPCRPPGTPPVDAFDFFRRSSVNSSASSEGETSAPVHSGDAGSEFHPPAPNNGNQEMVGAGVAATMAPGPGSDGMDPGWGQMQGNINLVTVQGNVNLVLGGPAAQGMANLGWGTNPGPNWANPNSIRSPRNGNLPWDGQRKYGGERFNCPREWGYQGSEPGFGRGRPPWGRQPYGGGGGYSRPLPKGQRVCKFYESGHCKKGAFCDYLHP